MAENEYSMLWATSTSGDGADAYTSEETRTLWASMFTNGVMRSYLNSLAVSGTSSPISIATGAAVIQGFPYFNTGDAVSKAISTPSTGTTGFRVVVRVDWLGRAESAVTPPLYPATTQYTARIVVITSADGTATIPDAITTDGDTYDLTLATGTITTAGVIALTDARTYANARRSSRTRAFMVPPIGPATYNNINGSLMGNDSTSQFYGIFDVPRDYVSDMVVSALLLNANSMAPLNGNIRASLDIEHGWFNEDPWTHLIDGDETTVAITENERYIAVLATPMPSASAGDMVRLHFVRDGADALDTERGGALYFVSFKVTYTADI